MTETNPPGDVPSTMREYVEGPPLVSSERIEPGELRPLPGAVRPELWLTGTGTPLVMPERAGPSTTLRLGEDIVVVDCGNATAYQLMRLGIRPKQVTHLFLTHHHVDHNVDLGFLLMAPWVERGPHRPPVVVGPPGTTAYVDRVLAAHDYDLRVRRPHGWDPAGVVPRVLEVEDGTVVGGRGWRARAIRVDHGPVDEAFGFRFDTEHASVAISGDTRPCDNLVQQATGVDVLVHEALYPGFGIPEYHTLSTEVGAIAARARAGHLVLTHLIPGHLDDERWREHVRRDYTGRLDVGRDLMKIL